MAVLKVVKGSCPGQLIEIQGERTVMGRLPSCQIVLENAAVSRNHAQILESHGTYYVEDLRSRNGTLVNGNRISGRTELRDGDEISVCEMSLNFYVGLPPDSALGKPQIKILPRPNPNTEAQSKATITPIDNLAEQFAANGIDKETADGEKSVPDSSSIITSFDVKMRDPRIVVRPEAKLRAILEITQNLARTLKIEEVLPKILESLFKLFPQADRGFIVLKDQTTDQIHIKSQRVRRDDLLDTTRVSTTILREAMEKGVALLSADAKSDVRFKFSESVAAMTIRSVMCVPMMSQTGEALGAIQIDTVSHGQPFTAEDLDILASVAAQSALALENGQLYNAALKQRDLERDLEFASQVQLGFLPHGRPKAAGYDFFDYYEAAQRVGGDFFDYVMLPDGRIAMTIGDVAGKGMPAALLMARIYADTRYQLLARPTPAEAVTSLNEGVAASGLGHRFITLAIVVLDPKSNTLTIVNAGHLPPLLRRTNGEVVPLATQVSSLPLGIQHNTVYAQTQLPIEKGEVVFLSTDGVTESVNPQLEVYGTQRLTTCLKNGPASAAQLGEAVVNEIEEFGADLPPRDDVCIICFNRQA